MQNNQNPSRDIEEILGNSFQDVSGDSVFIFETDAEIDHDAGLVFDDSNTDEDETPVSSSVNLSFETAKEEEEKPVELFVPDTFEINEKYDTKPYFEEAPRIISTYVPTFTGASDNYRMVNDPRPRQNIKKDESSIDAICEYDEDIDPTAEIDDNIEIENATPVKNGGEDEKELESVSKVFKFTENELVEEAEIVEHTVVTESEQIQEELYEREEPVEKGREYYIPDPDVSAEMTSVTSFASPFAIGGHMALMDPPADVGERLENQCSNEYTSYAQRDSFKDKYLDKIMSVRVRFFACAAITFILLIMETAFAAGINIARLLNLVTVSGAMALIDIQFVVCLFLISLPETVNAVRMLVRKKVTPELYILLSFVALISYTAIVVAVSPASYPLFGILFAVAVLASIGGTYYKISAEFTAFKLASANREKSIIDNRYTRTLERENAALDGAIEEHKSRIVRLFRTAFLSDFFERVEKTTENSVNVLITLASSLGLALVAGVVALFIPGGAVNAASAFAMVLMTAFPVISVIEQKHPYYHATCEAESERSAVIGEAALVDYAGVDVIAFEDSEVFGAEDVTLQRVMLYGQSDNLSKALRQMSALFMHVGGPIDLLFSNSLDRKCAPVEDVEIFEDGVIGAIDGVDIAGGNLKFMRERGMEIPDDEDKAETLSDSIRVMYAAENGRVYAKFYIRFSFSEDFSMILPALDDERIKVLVYTRAPGINTELMKTLTAGADKIRVIRKNTPICQDNPLYNKVSAGAVTFGEKVNAINTVIIAKKYAALESGIRVSEHIAMAVGGVLAFLLSVGGMFIVPPIALALWQSALCLALHIISKTTFRFNKNKKGK